MNARLEYKYLVPIDKMDSLRNDMLPFMEYDSFAEKMENKEYICRSIYCDSYDFKCYNEKIDGSRNRKKYRIRGYNYLTDDSKVFIEIKHKDENIISKDRGLVYYNKLGKLFGDFYDGSVFDSNEREPKNKKSIDKFMFSYSKRKLSPLLLIVYEREAYQCKFNSSLRITFDKNLRSSVERSFSGLFYDDNLVSCMDNFFVLEVKFYMVIPAWVPRVINKYNLQRTSVSKYAICFDKHKQQIK